MTMQIAHPALQGATPAPMSAARPAEATAGPFAHLLRQSQSTRAVPNDAARHPAEPAAATASPETEAAPETEAPQAPAAGFKPRLKPGDKAAAPRAAERSARAGPAPDAASETATTAKAEASGTKRGTEPGADPALSPWLAALQRPLDTAAPAIENASSGSAPAGKGDAASADTSSCTKADDKLLAQDKAAADTQARLDAAAAAHTTPPSWSAAASADDAALRAARPQAEDAGHAKPVATDATPSAAALGAAGFNPLLGNSHEAATPLTVNLPTPLASPEFAQALGLQMSVLATDGVQRAELQLNPAEMGPVSVQIVIDGSSAQIDFGADLAATRHAIEAGLPELAGALRDAGFTLTGGGVSQHSGGRSGSHDTASRDPHGGTHARHDADTGGVAASALRLRRTVAAGGVDLYA